MHVMSKGGIQPSTTPSNPSSSQPPPLILMPPGQADIGSHQVQYGTVLYSSPLLYQYNTRMSASTATARAAIRTLMIHRSSVFRHAITYGGLGTYPPICRFVLYVTLSSAPIAVIPYSYSTRMPLVCRRTYRSTYDDGHHVIRGQSIRRLRHGAEGNQQLPGGTSPPGWWHCHRNQSSSSSSSGCAGT